ETPTVAPAVAVGGRTGTRDAAQPGTKLERSQRAAAHGDAKVVERLQSGGGGNRTPTARASPGGGSGWKPRGCQRLVSRLRRGPVPETARQDPLRAPKFRD